MNGTARTLRRRLPRVHRRLDGETWTYVEGRTGGGHIWLVHLPSGRRVTAPSSASCHRSEMNLMKLMDRYERGVFR